MIDRFLSLHFLCLSICLVVPTVMLSSQVEQLREEVEQIIYYETDVNLEKVGFVLGILDGDSTFILSFDDCDRPVPCDLDENSVFELGGLTKVFTATLCHLLAEDGLIDLDDPVNSYIPETYRNNRLAQLTVESLLNHTSGLPKVPLNLGQKSTDLSNPYSNYSTDQILQYYSSLSDDDLNQPYTYSHLNYALLQYIITNIEQKPSLDQLFQKYISGPLDLNQTSFSSSTNLVTGFDRADRIAQPWSLDAFSGSEGLRSSIKDLAVITRYLMDPTKDLNRTFRKQVAGQYKIPRSKKTYVAHAWHVFRNKKYPDIYLHSGKTSGHGAMIAMVEETRTAVILLTNTVTSMDGLGVLILRMINDNWKRRSNG